MTAELTRQYRPIGDTDTAGDDALSVRDIRELAAGLNNFKAHMAGKMYGRLSGSWTAAGAYQWASTNDSNTEQVVDFVTRPLATGYTRIIFQIGGVMTAVPWGNCYWKLYASTKRYNGPKLFDSSYLGPIYESSSSIGITSATHQCPVANADLVAMRDGNGDCHLTLTAKNDVAREGEFCMLSSIAATPKIGDWSGGS